MLSVVNGSVGRGRCGSVFEPRNNASAYGYCATSALKLTEPLRLHNVPSEIGISYTSR